jgi:hypothetical protein
VPPPTGVASAGGERKSETLRDLLGIAAAGRGDEPTEGLPWAVLDGLFERVTCMHSRTAAVARLMPHLPAARSPI